MNLPELTTERLLLRPVLLSDAKDLFGLRSNTGQMKYIPRPVMQNMAEAEKMIADIQQGEADNTLLNWTMVLKETGGVFGRFRVLPFAS